jgi:hypothetical protein
VVLAEDELENENEVAKLKFELVEKLKFVLKLKAGGVAKLKVKPPVSV